MRKRNLPIIVEVTEKDWFATSATSSKATARDRVLYLTLQGMGGVSGTVPPGFYEFNLKWKWFRNIATLTPIKK